METESLVAAAAYIADGKDVDWPSITSTLSSGEDRALADQLEIVARIAAGHRQLHQLLPDPAKIPDEPTLGRSRWGHLELIDIVARGSYGTVYRAWDTRLERLVALKLFHGAPDPGAVMTEGRMLARVRHEHVVTVFDADVIDGVAGLWMELVHGRTLDQIVKQDGPMDPAEAAATGLDVARALAAVHGAALLHCDVKAQNVVRENGGRVVLMDLGAGRAVPDAGEIDQVSDVTGTPRYMAPELFQAGASATKATDVYSLGVLLYYLVSGRFPVDGTSLGELKRAHATGQVTPLDEAREGLPAGYVALVSGALNREPASRPESAAAMESALSRLATPLTPAVNTTRRLWPWMAAAIGAGLLSLVVLRPGLFTPAPATVATRSIAVLPFRNLTGDPSKAYLSDGLTEVLISNLARVRALRVPSVEAVWPFRNSEEELTVLGKKLGVQLLLAGSVTQADNRIRATVRLIDAATGVVLWKDEIERERSGLLSAQAEIARMVASRLEINLSQMEERALAQASIDPRAQEAYLRGLALDLAAPQRVKEAAQAFQLAVEIEPRFARALAGLAHSESLLLQQTTGVDRTARAQVVRDLAERAISIDPTLASGYVALGSVQFYHDWTFPTAEQAFRRALEVDPSNAFAHQRLSMLLAALGRHDEAIALGRQAVLVEPLVARRATSLGIAYYYARDYDRATQEAQRALMLSPGYPVAHFELGRIESALGHHDAAIAQLEAALKGSRTSGYLVELARAYAAAGQPSKKQEVLNEVFAREKVGEAYSLDNLAYIAAAEGKVDDALAILERAVQGHLTNALWIAVDPRVDPLRSDPRFDRLLSKAGLKP